MTHPYYVFFHFITSIITFQPFFSTIFSTTPKKGNGPEEKSNSGPSKKLFLFWFLADVDAIPHQQPTLSVSLWKRPLKLDSQERYYSIQKV